MREYKLSHLIAKAIRYLPPAAQLSERSGWALHVPEGYLDTIFWKRSQAEALWGFSLETVEGLESLRIVSPDGIRFDILIGDNGFKALDYLDCICWQTKDREPADPPIYESHLMLVIEDDIQIIDDAWSGSDKRGKGAGAVKTKDHRVITWKTLPGTPSNTEILDKVSKGVNQHESAGHAAVAWAAFLETIPG